MLNYKTFDLKTEFGECSFRLVEIPAGSFIMQEGEENTLQVDMPSFWLAETLTTQELWQTVLGENPSNFKDKNRPVEQISWEDIKQKFLPKLNELLKDQTYKVSENLIGLEFDLPTEAEWEYAARGGDGNKYKYAGSNNAEEVGWYDGNSPEETKPVALLKPNSFGLYDISGNVYEWTNTQWNMDFTENINKRIMTTSTEVRLAMRGGSWYSNDNILRLVIRDLSLPSIRTSYFYGFRFGVFL